MEYIPAKTIVSKKRNSGESWFGINYTMNIYKGCSHGCIYCDSRSDCYQVKEFDIIKPKQNAIKIIEQDLYKRRKKGIIGTGSMSDPYNPLEKKLELTRQSLEIINRYQYGLSIITKSDLIVRDIDLLKKINEHSPLIVKMTITCNEDKLSSLIEPNVVVSSKRFAALKKLSESGIYCGILLMPILPFINDTKENIIGIVKKASESKVNFIYPYFGVSLRANQKEYFYQQLDKLFPGCKQAYMKYYYNHFWCLSNNQKELYTIFAQECDKYQIKYKMKDIIEGYTKDKSKISGNNVVQMQLF